MQKIVRCVYVSGILLFLTATTAIAAEFSVRFGELQGADRTVIMPTRNIKLCDKPTGYRFGYEIIPQGNSAYEHYAIFRLPAPIKQVGPNLQKQGVKVEEQGLEVKTRRAVDTGRRVEPFNFDQGDPSGEWKVEIYVEDKLIDTIAFQVASVASCP